MKDAYQLVEQFSRLAAADIGDSQDSRGIMDPELQPLDHRMKFAGVAVTVQCAAGDQLPIHKAMAIAKPGSVLVITGNAAAKCAMIGDLFATMCKAKGIRGMVLDGCCRDKASLIEMGFPVFCKGLDLHKPVSKDPGAVNVPVGCGGVEVAPGDLVVGDADGVVVIKQEEAEEVLQKAIQYDQMQENRRKQCEQGKTTVEVMDLFDKLGMTPEDLKG